MRPKSIMDEANKKFNWFQYRKRYEVTCDEYPRDMYEVCRFRFQYRKRYEVTCDWVTVIRTYLDDGFQYRKRYEVTCDTARAVARTFRRVRFNTASGMRSHATGRKSPSGLRFYRFNTASGMRSHATCSKWATPQSSSLGFNTASGMRSHATPSRVQTRGPLSRFNTASGMRSHVTGCESVEAGTCNAGFNTASGMRSHVTIKCFSEKEEAKEFQYRKRYEVTCDCQDATRGYSNYGVSIPQAV